jgi:hypothetical protein
MSDQREDANRQAAGERVVSERCLCRELLDHLRVHLGVSPEVRQHLANSRIEFLKAIREVLNERIEHLSKTAERGTKVQVE